MPVFSNRDLALDVSNDLVVESNGDIRRSSTVQGLKQILEFRVRTAFNEWPQDPTMMANLTRFIGENNTEDTGKAIESAILQALGKDVAFLGSNISVSVVPTSPSEVAMFINVGNISTDDGITTSLSAAFSLDFTTGNVVGIM